MEILTQLSELYAKDAGRMREYADKLQEGMKQAEILGPEPMDSFTPELMQSALGEWKGRMDTIHGCRGWSLWPNGSVHVLQECAKCDKE